MLLNLLCEEDAKAAYALAKDNTAASEQSMTHHSETRHLVSQPKKLIFKIVSYGLYFNLGIDITPLLNMKLQEINILI